MRAVLANIVVCTQRKCLQIFDTDYWVRLLAEEATAAAEEAIPITMEA
jgi:hypothetical protein